jgi:ribosomal protein S18 acetylase RimI-like enzyme
MQRDPTPLLPTDPAPAGIVFRLIQPGDDPSLLSCYSEAFVGQGGISSPTSLAAWWSERSDVVRSASIAAIAERDVVGYCLVGEASVRELAVRGQYRRMGVARGLMSRAFEILGADSSPVTLQVESSNDSGALELYASLGFRTISQLTIWRRDVRAHV